ncbi:MAG: class I SAM-dependent methyltransferase [Planctomycetota bacterium]|jgi:2-polyprenyl-3-methyl-5-hydroxy-6-metoxy-1,4-benzoquinol methylase
MCNACSPALVDATPDSFGEKMLEVMNNSALGLLLSLGHRTGLFDAMQGAGWLSSADLAEQAGLNERYVREWLGGVVTGRIVEFCDSDDDGIFGYRLPDAHAEILCRSGESMATVFQWISVLGGVESDIVEVFEKGGGVPYERFDRFHEVMAEESNLSVVSGLHEHIVPLVDGLDEQLERGIDVLDVGCGSGMAICELASRYPSSRFTGFDLCEPAVEAARAHAKQHGLTNVTFETQDVSQLHDENLFDLVTGFDVVHDQRDPEGVLQAIRRVLRPEGTFLMQDLRCHTNVGENIGHPLCPFLYTISTMHCMTVSLAQGGAGLGAAWGEELAVEMLNDAGFEGVTVNTLPHDIQNNWYVMRKPEAVLAGVA